ncbi:MAG: molybdopterin molybdotransferase MoeA [Hyphomonadaceae bacterium]|jgi:molybdopterin molybdotransferase|nr:molybdopterin molybdotransferase MoeA [Hyphomonadaceae bacterium]
MGKTNKLLDDCFAHDKTRLRHDEALRILKQRVGPIATHERVALAEACGRILAETAVAPDPVPAHTNAAVDGFSFAARDYDVSAGSELPVDGRAAAGHRLGYTPAAATAARIFTGAVMPQGHDTVVMQEDVRFGTREGRAVVAIPGGLKAGANVRKAGEDVKAGEVLLQAGTVLRPQDLAALASIGAGDVECFARLKVGIVSTGDEVVRPGAALAAGQVYDANAPMLAALIASAGATPVDLGVLADNLDAVKASLTRAAQQVDVIISSGGASRGEEDHVVAAVDALGKRHLWQLAIKPGRPMSFGQIGDCVLLGLPGNPVAVFVCFLLYVWPMLRRMGGAGWPEPRRTRLPALFAFPGRKVGRREFWRGLLKETPRGLAVDKFARDGSGLISGLRAADGLIDIPEDVPEIRPGDSVAFIPFSEFGILGR